MDTISDFKLMDSLGGYDKAANPKGLGLFNLLPHGVTWLCNGKRHEIKHGNKIIPLLLKENDGIALIKSPFNKKDNQAYIVTPSNKIKWNVGDLLKKHIEGAIFLDVYFILDELFFFVNLDGRDYRFAFEPKTGEIGKLIASY
ncbi:hypothetical protein [Dickeya solani]|uniref:Uncharacterized protein n=1 Tax=Dickeya solani TaxID=1089444 RepID=A0AAX4ETU9_9GAMM|nr:hypothetical protein [Dickeya solani]WOA50884.1 hypothetical protein RXA29_13070 [Dickeya solani]WOA50893.1 hypothetical protein RXA29_13115 [Dickeya solani]